jgi:hypothetical protein
LVGGDQLGIADGPHELRFPERRLPLRVRPLMRAALLAANAGDARTAKATATPVIAFRNIG